MVCLAAVVIIYWIFSVQFLDQQDQPNVKASSAVYHTVEKVFLQFWKKENVVQDAQVNKL